MKLRRKSRKAKSNVNVTVNAMGGVEPSLQSALANAVNSTDYTAATVSNGTGGPDHVKYDSEKGTTETVRKCNNPNCPVHGTKVLKVGGYIPDGTPEYPTFIEMGSPFFVPSVNAHHDDLVESLSAAFTALGKKSGIVPTDMSAVVDRLAATSLVNVENNEAALHDAHILGVLVGETLDAVNALIEQLSADDADTDDFMEVSADHVFDALINDDEHVMMGNPVIYESDDEQSVHFARFFFRNDPYLVICRVTEDDESINRAYVYLDDDHGFTAFHNMLAIRMMRRNGSID